MYVPGVASVLISLANWVAKKTGLPARLAFILIGIAVGVLAYFVSPSHGFDDLLSWVGAFAGVALLVAIFMPQYFLSNKKKESAKPHRYAHSGPSGGERRREETDEAQEARGRARREREENTSGSGERRSGGWSPSSIDEARAVFDLPQDFDCETMRKRFREMTQKLHPDKGGSHFFQSQLNAAYQTLRRFRNCP